MRWLVGAAAKGVIGGIQGTAEGSATAGVKAVGQWLAGRVRPGSRVSTAVFSEPPRGLGRREYGQSLLPATCVEILGDAEEHHQGLRFIRVRLKSSRYRLI